MTEEDGVINEWGQTAGSEVGQGRFLHRKFVFLLVLKEASPPQLSHTIQHTPIRADKWKLTLTARKLRPLSFARALAIMVLEQPGGP